MKTILKTTALASLLFWGMMNGYAQGGADRNPGFFNAIKVNGVTNVELVQGAVSGIHIEGPAELVEKVTTTLEGEKIVVSSGDGGSKMKIILTAPAFNSIETTGSANVKSQGKLTGDKLKIETSGASDIELDAEFAGIDVVATGASDIKLTGKTQTLNADVSGASDLKAYGLETETAKLNASGSSDIKVNVKTSITADASGASDIRFVGTPSDKTLNRSGSSDIRHKDDASSDTTRVGVGKKKYTIISDDKDDDDNDFTAKYNGDFKFWSGLDLHMNALVDAKNNIDPLPGYEFMELNYPRSIGISWNMFQKNIHIYKNYVNLVTGFGLDWSVYSFRNNITLRHDTSFLAATLDTVDYKRNRFRAMYVQVPLMLEFNTNTNADHSFHIAAGVLVGYNVFDNKLKQKYEVDGNEKKNVVKDDFNVNPVRYGLTARVGYGDFSLFANYNVSTLFEKDRAPKMYPVQVGFHLGF